ncbi:thiamine/molybdopterin biosynthesis protein [Streptomyces rubiginosohelvolus]|uniref:HesA/MoeB/ThiF family protein n=1 Tax=Streptomyces rubiginosohelvolus TaxID=67362 RepID=UPI001672C862|nr:ThiF family adenylyltransferase [Streptomyces rubiginosohelvolus]GGS25287.1 thiamine/molybdopterin biosynthesis protein [Streptomyces rubiginosohelvolus]
MRFPQVKEEHEPYRFDDGTIRIGGELYGTAAEIVDSHGWVWDALTLMDGETSVSRIEDELVSRHTPLGRPGARKVITTLLKSGYIEDSAAADPTGLSPHEIERYSRNHAFFRRVDLRARVDPWDSQLSLKRAKVLVLGLGGVGSHAAWSLAAAGVGSLHCIDPDSIEESNLTRQVLYAESDVGRSKAEVAVERLSAVNSSGSFTYEKRMVDTESELTDLVAGFDVFALCADEPRQGFIASLTNRVCAAQGVPWVSAGYNGPMVAVGVYAPTGPCYECIAAGEEEKLKPGAQLHLNGRGVLAPLAGIAGQLVAYEVISLITGIGRLAPGYVRGLNLISPDQHVLVQHPARPSCELCHPHRQGGRRSANP